MKSHLLIALILAGLVSGCANPLNRATSDRYMETCSKAESRGDLAVAEEACYRAAVNVDWGNLGPELRSERLYNLGRVKRKVGKFNEAEQVLKESLAVEKELSGPSSTKTGRRLAELSATYYQSNKITEGVAVVEKLKPIANQYTGNERKFMAALFFEYGKKMAEKGDLELSKSFESEGSKLGYSASDFE